MIKLAPIENGYIDNTAYCAIPGPGNIGVRRDPPEYSKAGDHSGY